MHAIPRYLKLMAEAGFSRPNISFVIARIRPWSMDVSGMEVDVRQFAELEADWLGQMQVLGLNSPVLGNIFSCTDHPLVPESERDAAASDPAQLSARDARPRL